MNELRGGARKFLEKLRDGRGVLPHVEADRAARLMTQYLDGDAQAFRALYAGVGPRLLSYLRTLAGDEATAEDVLQQTFLKAHEARHAYVRGANPLPWLYAIAFRTCVDELRRRKRTVLGAIGEELHAELTGVPERGESLPAAIDEAALAAVEALPAAQREAMILTKLQGKSIAEVAALTGATPTAIKLRIHRGYQALRRRLAHWLEGS